MAKPITEEGLRKDAQMVRYGMPLFDQIEGFCPPRKGLRVIDVASGSGKFGLYYAYHGAVVTLLDPDPEPMAYARALRDTVDPTLTPEFLEASVFDPKVRARNGTYDLVVSEGLAHHFPRSDPRRQGSLEALVRLAKSGGSVVVMVTNGLSPAEQQMVRETRHQYWGMPETQEPFTPEELSHGLVRAGVGAVVTVPGLGTTWQDARLILGWGVA